jgi:hypothetical protein
MKMAILPLSVGPTASSTFNLSSMAMAHNVLPEPTPARPRRSCHAPAPGRGGAPPRRSSGGADLWSSEEAAVGA